VTNLRKLDGAGSTPITLVERTAFPAWLSAQPPAVQNWAAALGVGPDAGAWFILPGPDGGRDRVVAVIDRRDSLWGYARIAGALPAGCYRLDVALSEAESNTAALGWALGGYCFDRYRRQRKTSEGALLLWPEHADLAVVERAASATQLVRDLINLPACDLGPAELAQAATDLGAEFQAETRVLRGTEVRDKGFPAVYTVGQAAARPPHLIDLHWGRRDDPKVTLVGKGVCFDTGGLDLKPGSNMRLMKKDMGGAAHVLGLARMIMMAGLPVRLRVLIPAVENAVSGNAMRPGDILRTRNGLSVEIGDTDAEGRLILADGLTAAAEESPALIIDFATLTGAARVALGTDVPALFCNDDTVADALLAVGRATEDPLWRLPLWQPYGSALESKVADLVNVANHRYAGAIIAALFLERFLPGSAPWVHIDLMAWNTNGRPGRPEGGEAMGIRAVFAYLSTCYG